MIPADQVSKDTYDIVDYALENRASATVQNGTPGAITKVYVNDKPETSETGAKSGKYVIIEVNTDYHDIPTGMMSSVPAYDQAMYAGVTQVKDIALANGTAIPASDKEVGNYTESENSGGMGGGFDDGFVPGLGGIDGPDGGMGGGFGGPDGGMGGGFGGPGGDLGGGFGGPDGNIGGPGGLGGGTSKIAKPGTYRIRIAEDFEIHGTTKYDTDLLEPIFVEHCYNEQTGNYDDVTLPYALYVPADYSADKEYALVIQIHDAGSLSDDPMTALVESQSATNFASDWAREIVRTQGLDGIIVVAPAISQQMKSADDNYSVNSTVPATWALLDKLTEDYNINMDHIYGTGQSMGGMQILAMAAQRDNYFAGVWANGCQWGNNMNLESPYTTKGMGGGGTLTCTPASSNEWYITSGNEYRNWYYMVSDDNILITNCQGDNFATTTWTELAYLYSDLVGAEIPHKVFDPYTVTNAEIESFLSAKNTTDNLGFMWTTFKGGSHMATWVFSHGFHAHAEWLLKQTRTTENAREKLNLNKPFEAADKQERRPLPAASSVSYVTGKAGAGTLGYNTGWYDPNGNVTTGHEPGWTLFNDVNLGSYYGNAVLWALDEGITKGTSATTFSPNSNVTRAQVVTFLWRAADKPEPTIDNPFTDVDPVKHKDFYKAILWAYEKGITDGSNSTGTTFSPDATCTRSQIITFLWRTADKPEPTIDNPFTDVDPVKHRDFYKAILWAYEKDITGGSNSASTTFSPDATCTRGQCVTFLYRCFGD